MKGNGKAKKLRGLHAKHHPSDYCPTLKRKAIIQRSTIKIYNLAKPRGHPLLRYGTAADHAVSGYMHNGKYCIGGYNL
jgi:hypothetical protein